MNQHPILFSPAMVSAIQAGRKTQTRRTVKDIPHLHVERPTKMDDEWWRFSWPGQQISSSPAPAPWAKSPYGKTGEILWVRETVQIAHRIGHVAVRYSDGEVRVWENEREEYDPGATVRIDWSPIKKTPSIHVPKRYVRLWLRITDVRAEGLQDITEADAIAEGIGSRPHSEDANLTLWFDYGPAKCFAHGKGWGPTGSFRTLWESINGPGSWNTNPFAWVVNFEVIANPNTPTP